MRPAGPAGGSGALGRGAERVRLIHCGTLLAVPGQAPVKNVTVVVRSGVIDRVAEGFLSTLDGQPTEVVDLKDRFVMPGLIDCHTHITGQYTRDVRLRGVTETDADAAIMGVVHAERTLRAGFTTIRNVGSSGDAAFALRDAINAGLVIGPRILEAGESISPTGGHSDGTLGYRDDLFGLPGAREGIADGADACRQAVRAQVKRGADVIKLTATGGVLSNTAQGLEQQFFDDELASIVQTAHQLGRKVAAHAHGAAGIKAALRAGVDSIEHGTYIDEGAIALFKEKGAYYVPTIHAARFVGERALEPGFFPAPVVPKALAVGPQIQQALARAYKAGVKIAFGTDVGVGEHGTNALEFVYMTEAGMTNMDAIVSATVHAADLCGIADRVGTVEAGKRADMVAYTGDPLADIRVLLGRPVVIRDGAVHRPR
ncbi:MAG: amidohydrolase [Isosphaera sp.]|nr:amidohydrolase [Isosphaera sp.]